MTRKVNVKIPRTAAEYDIVIGDGVLSECGRSAAELPAGKPQKAAIISDPTVHALYGETAEASFREAGIGVRTHLIGDGEEFKNFKTLSETLEFLGANEIARTDIVVALGGGVVGDLAGFAAAVHLRGVRLLQIPTTLLSMIDSSVGGKTAVNTAFGKNLVGGFYQPSRVLIDVAALRTLPEREITAGKCEAIKQAAVAGPELFELTRRFVENNAENVVELIAAQTAFKAAVVQADERESTAETGGSSRKILNFGHTFAHALEKLTDYRYFKHGEAVGHGIKFAAELSKKLENFPADEVKLLNDVVHRAGNLPPIVDIDPAEIFESFKFDKKLVNNSLHWVLLERIGKPVIVPSEKIPKEILMATIAEAVRQ